jgi:hypothetical protein
MTEEVIHPGWIDAAPARRGRTGAGAVDQLQLIGEGSV